MLQPSLALRRGQIMIVTPREGQFDKTARLKSIQFVIQSIHISLTINHPGHSCHIHNPINPPYQGNSGSFRSSLNGSLINTFHLVCLIYKRMDVY